MKGKDGVSFFAGIAKSILASKVTLFFCWIGLLVLFVLIVLHKGYQEWWFVPLLIGLGAYLFGFGIWWMIKNHKYLKFQSFVGWLIVFTIFPGSIIALVLWGDQWWFQLLAICLGIWGLTTTILRSKNNWLRYTAVGLLLFFAWFWGRELINLLPILFQWLANLVEIKWIIYYFKYIIFALITNAPVFAPVFIMLGLIFFVIYHIINIRRRAT